MSTTTRPSLLLVEDDASLGLVLARELGRSGFVVTLHATGEGVVERARDVEPDLVLLDLHLPAVAGLDVLTALRRQDGDRPVVVFTGQGSIDAAVQAMHRGAFDFLTKPVGLDVLEATLRRALEHGALLRENRRLHSVVGASGSASPVTLPSEPSMRLEERIARVAAAEPSVLIGGESGTGKELVARRVHAGSPRRHGPFVVLHCGAIPRQLVESELFGHTKGAFTGAEQRRSGLFEAADGGTLFLDEVGELPLEVQPALLRALQFGEIRPVGSDRVRKVDVRIVAATHRDLRAAVATGAFREDLFYRLNVLELHVPPLRERSADVEPLATAFLQREALRAGRPLHFDRAALDRLRAHAWPGNVRELENAVVRLGVLADGPTVGAADVDEIVFGSGRTSQGVGGGTAGVLPTLSLPELERLAIDAALRRFDGNKTRAAQALGIALKTLYNKLNAREPDDGSA